MTLVVSPIYEHGQTFCEGDFIDTSWRGNIILINSWSKVLKFILVPYQGPNYGYGLSWIILSLSLTVLSISLTDLGLMVYIG